MPEVSLGSNGTRRALEGQRRQVTVLFTDMTGFTRASEKLGAERTYALIQRLSQLMADAVHEHKGTIGNFTGDGIMALFGAPAAVEDAPLRACRAALDIQSRMRDREDALVAEFGLCPSLRIGIHTGQAVVGEVGADLPTDVTALGDTVNLASRIESAAESGGILMSEATYTLVEGYVEARFARGARGQGQGSAAAHLSPRRPQVRDRALRRRGAPRPHAAGGPPARAGDLGALLGGGARRRPSDRQRGG